MNFKAKKLIAPLFALLLAGYLAGCDIGSGSGFIPITPGQNPGHSASEMTQTQTEAATSQPITVATTTKTLVLTGAAGKTIYMARSNISDTAMNSLYSRLARITSGGGSASAEKSALSFQEEETEIQAAIVSGFETDLENDPHAKIWKLSMDNVKKAKAQGLISKSLAPGVQAAVKNYAVGDTGGVDTVTLTTEQMPKHKHTVYGRSSGYAGAHNNSPEVITYATKNWGAPDRFYKINDTSEEGSSQAHENRPPYYALAFIMRMK